VILYVDTSSLLKLYFQEDGTAEVKALTAQARGVASSMIGYVEARSGLVRGRRGGRLTDGEYAAALRAFEQDWTSYVAYDVTDGLVHEAAALAERHFLRGLDAIHLASALGLQDQLGEAVTFSSADGRLMAAASAEGLALGR